MTNPAAAVRMLITYAICIPVAITVGYMLTNPLDYGTMGFLALIAALLLSPIFIKWHYPILVLGIGLPMSCFFLVGKPPSWEVVALLSFGIAIVERTLSSQRRFFSPSSLTWPMLYLGAMALFTAQLTGGIGLHALGGETGGGKKYLAIWCGIAMFFALCSQKIPAEKRNLYVALFFLAGVPAFISDMFPFLPSPLNYINLLFPPSSYADSGGSAVVVRYGNMGLAASFVAQFLLARYGLRGVLSAAHPLRTAFFLLLQAFSLVGGFRTMMANNLMTFAILFFMEGLHRTRMILVLVMGGLLVGTLTVAFSDKMPLNIQRAMSILPVKLSPQATLDAQGSSEWRYRMWRDVWPKVPQYLLLGKGYALTAEDFQLMGHDVVFGYAASLDASQQGLAISFDYHNGPLSTLMPFGIWGAIGIFWLQMAGLRLLYRNYRYGDPGLMPVNRLLLVMFALLVFSFYFVFGAFSDDVGHYARLLGFSVALNWGIRSPQPQPFASPRIKPLPAPSSAPQPA